MGVATMGVFSSSSIADGVVTHAKLAPAAVAVNVMANEGTSGYVLMSNGAGSPPSYQSVAASTDVSLISRQTLGGAANTISFTTIGASFKNFLLYFSVKGDASTNNTFKLRLNNDSGNNYDYTGQFNNNGTIAVTHNAADSGHVINATCVANEYFYGVIHIGNEAVFNRPISSTCNHSNGTDSSDATINVGAWESASAITQIDLVMGAGNMVATSMASLYGLK